MVRNLPYLTDLATILSAAVIVSSMSAHEVDDAFSLARARYKDKKKVHTFALLCPSFRGNSHREYDGIHRR